MVQHGGPTKGPCWLNAEGLLEVFLCKVRRHIALKMRFRFITPTYKPCSPYHSTVAQESNHRHCTDCSPCSSGQSTFPPLIHCVHETHQQKQQLDSAWGFVQLFYISLFLILFGGFLTIGAQTQTVVCECVSFPLSCVTGCGRSVDDEVMEMLGGHGHCDAGWLLLWNRHLPKRSVARGRLSWTVSASQLPSTHPHTFTHAHTHTHAH